MLLSFLSQLAVTSIGKTNTLLVLKTLQFMEARSNQRNKDYDARVRDHMYSGEHYY